MKPNNILSASLIDLIFDGRNKEYGAYYLRNTYEQRIKKALIVTFSIVFLAVGGTALAGKSKKPINKDIVDREIEIMKLPPDEKKIVPPPIKQNPPPQEVQVRTERLTEMIVVNKEVIEPPPTQDVLITAKIGVDKIDGIDNLNIAAPEIKKGITKGIIQEKVDKDDDEIVPIVEIEASFIGNWIKFLERNLDGDTPVRNGAGAGRYTVVIQFVVDKEGKVSDIKPLTNHGYGLEEEAVRVLKKAPKWKPAIQNGHEVKAYRRQMITFEVVEDY